MRKKVKESNNRRRSGNSKFFIIFCAFLLVFLVSLVESSTGYYVRITFFYGFFVLLVSWYLGNTWGIMFTFLSACIWFFMNFQQLPAGVSHIVHYWNALSLLLILSMISYVVSALKMEKAEAAFAVEDMLTGALNVRGLKERLSDIVTRTHLKKSKSFSAVYIDLDNFKKVNDKFGHREGDKVLRTIGKVIRYHIREVDIFARVGGDEFVLIIPDIGDNIVVKRIHLIRKILLQAMKKRKWPVTFSIGLANFHKIPKNIMEIVGIADETMYLAKKEGKNRIVSKNY